MSPSDAKGRPRRARTSFSQRRRRLGDAWAEARLGWTGRRDGWVTRIAATIDGTESQFTQAPSLVCEKGRGGKPRGELRSGYDAGDVTGGAAANALLREPRRLQRRTPGAGLGRRWGEKPVACRVCRRTAPDCAEERGGGWVEYAHAERVPHHFARCGSNARRQRLATATFGYPQAIRPVVQCSTRSSPSDDGTTAEGAHGMTLGAARDGRAVSEVEGSPPRRRRPWRLLPRFAPPGRFASTRPKDANQASPLCCPYDPLGFPCASLALPFAHPRSSLGTTPPLAPSPRGNREAERRPYPEIRPTATLGGAYVAPSLGPAKRVRAAGLARSACSIVIRSSAPVHRWPRRPKRPQAPSQSRCTQAPHARNIC